MDIRHVSRIAILLTAGLGMLCGGGGQARADLITVTFDSLPADFTALSTYTEKGFIVSGVNDSHFFTVTNPDNGTTAASFFQSDGVPMRFSFGGAPFNLISLDVPNVSGQAIFMSSSGATDTITGADQHQTIFFGPGFQDITSFELGEIDAPLSGFEGLIVVDNIALASPVPEPGGLVLFMSAAVSLMAYRWLRQRPSK